MAGMQGKPLPKKLGIKAGHRVCLLGAPRTIVRRLSCDEVRIAEDLRQPLIDVVVLFVDRVADLERRFADIVGRLHPAGGLWIASPKKSCAGSRWRPAWSTTRSARWATRWRFASSCAARTAMPWRIAPSHRRSRVACAGPQLRRVSCARAERARACIALALGRRSRSEPEPDLDRPQRKPPSHRRFAKVLIRRSVRAHER